MKKILFLIFFVIFSNNLQSAEIADVKNLEDCADKNYKFIDEARDWVLQKQPQKFINLYKLLTEKNAHNFTSPHMNIETLNNIGPDVFKYYSQSFDKFIYEKRSKQKQLVKRSIKTKLKNIHYKNAYIVCEQN